MTTVIGLAITPKIMQPMELRDTVSISIDDGIDGDARGRKRGRQVSIIFEEDWADAVAETGAPMPWSERRANILVRGMRAPQVAGGTFTIGTAVLKVAMETDPCALMESKRTGLRAAMMPNWRGGVCCTVVRGGDITIGDGVDYSA